MKKNEIIFLCICIGILMLDAILRINDEPNIKKEVIRIEKNCDSLKIENEILKEYIELLEDENKIMGSLLGEKEIAKPRSRTFKSVPGSNNVYRSRQPKLDELKTFLLNNNVNTVIRMNDTEGTGVTIKKERELVESMGKNFIWVNAHLGYQKGKGYVESLKLVQPILENGNVLIHCTAGKDRTGYMIGHYLLNHLNWTKDSVWNYTISLNEWELYIPQGKSGYIKYMEAFYPYDEWVKTH